jgi:transposase
LHDLGAARGTLSRGDLSMSRKRQTNGPGASAGDNKPQPIPILHPDAAGLDIGATEIYAAVASDRDEQPVRRFGTFTAELHALAAWLRQCGMKTIAMEATGVYWIPVFQILESYGFEVCLVNPRYFQNVPGRRTDVSDCQWLQRLHSAGLLQGSFRPSQQVCALRSLARHRDELIRLASTHILHMQKALDQMNVQLHHVLSDITGLSGLAIIDAILDGERNPTVLAELRDRRVKASTETIVQALTGDYRAEHLFTLKQSLDCYRHYQKMLAGCDREIEQELKRFETRVDVKVKPLAPPKVRRNKPVRNEPRFDLRKHLYRIFGVDLTEIPGISVLTANTILSEIGPDLSKFPNGSALASWLGLCPHNDITGGRVVSTKTRRVKNRAAHAFRLAANALFKSQSALGNYFRRMRAKLGAPEAITAAAHKLARIVYHMLSTRQPYDESILRKHEQQFRGRAEARLRAQAKALGYSIVPTKQ